MNRLGKSTFGFDDGKGWTESSMNDQGRRPYIRVNKVSFNVSKARLRRLTRHAMHNTR